MRDQSSVGVSCDQLLEPVPVDEQEVLHGARPAEGWASAGSEASADGARAVRFRNGADLGGAAALPQLRAGLDPGDDLGRHPGDAIGTDTAARREPLTFDVAIDRRAREAGLRDDSLDAPQELVGSAPAPLSIVTMARLLREAAQAAQRQRNRDYLGWMIERVPRSALEAAQADPQSFASRPRGRLRPCRQ